MKRGSTGNAMKGYRHIHNHLRNVSQVDMEMLYNIKMYWSSSCQVMCMSRWNLSGNY